MSVATAVTDSGLRLDFLSNFSPEDRIVSRRSQRETLSVPQIFLPKKVTAKVTDDLFDIQLTYFLDEVLEETKNNQGVTVSKGVNTGRIFSISVPLPRPDFTTLLNTMRKVGTLLKGEIKHTDSPVQKKNYELILSLVNKVVTQVTNNRETLVEEIFNAS